MGFLAVPSASNTLANAVFFPSANVGSTLTGLVNGTSYTIYSTTSGPVVTPVGATATTPTTEWQNIVPVGSGPTGTSAGTVTLVNGDYRVTTVAPNTNGRAKINLPAAGTEIEMEISLQWNDVTRLVCRQVSSDSDISVDSIIFDINRSAGDAAVMTRTERFTVQPGKTMLHFIGVSTAGQYFTINSSSRVRIAQTNSTANLSVINFTGSTYPSDSLIAYNNVFGDATNVESTAIASITNINGNPTGVGFSMSYTGNPSISPTAPGRGANREGEVSGLPTYSGQLLSAQVAKANHYVTNGVSIQIVLSNLVPSKNYTLGFVSSRIITENRFTIITANGVSFTQNSSSNPAVENNLVIPANAQGQINISVVPQSGTTYAYINGLSFRDALPNETVSTNPAASTAPAQFSTTGWSVATGSSPAQVTMNITTLPSNGGSAITALQYSINNGTSWTNLSGTGTGSRTLTMAANSTSYTFVIRAVNAIGNGTTSASKSATSGAASTTTPTTPVSNIRTFTYQNSLFDHQANGGADDDTRVPNWTQRMASNAGLTYQATGYFGFANQWPLPPRADVGYENVTVPSGVQQWTSTWSGYSNINMLTFVPDNFDSFDRAPNVNSTNSASPIGANQNYRDRLLQIIDAWETNAPMANGEKRKYRVYSGWADFNRSGGQWNTYTNTQLNTHLTYSYGQYQTWYVDLVNMLKTARPNLDIELIDLQRVVMLTWRNTALNTLAGSRMWEDQAPHGTETWYLLAAMVYYMEIYGVKPPANFNPLAGTGAGSGVSSVLIDNWSAIVDYAWTALGN